jgi:hypothetical protein
LRGAVAVIDHDNEKVGMVRHAHAPVLVGVGSLCFDGDCSTPRFVKLQ